MGVLAAIVSLVAAPAGAALVDVGLPAGVIDAGGLVGLTVASGLYGALGVTIGAVTRNQVAVVLVALAGIPLIEKLLGGVPPALALPSVATDVLIGMSDVAPTWDGATVLAAYCAAIGGIAIGSR